VGQQQRRQQQQQHSLGGSPAAAARRPQPQPLPRWISGVDGRPAGRSLQRPPPWAGAWRRLHRAAAPRAHRFLAWRVMHGALPVEARLAAWGGPARTSPGHLGACHRTACAGQPETITHALLSCPAARAAWQWAAGLWSAVSGLPPPPLTARVLLGGATQWATPPLPHHPSAPSHARPHPHPPDATVSVIRPPSPFGMRFVSLSFSTFGPLAAGVGAGAGQTPLWPLWLQW
jgi:hypothetical protein